jgi:hypothetical protein
MSLLIIIVLLLFTIMGFGSPGQSEPGIAVEAPAVATLPACDVAPRTAEEIATIRATPAAAEIAGTPGATQPADEETRAAIEQVVQMADSCAESGDYDRLAALYSAHAIQSGVLDAEVVPIEPGTPPATPQVAPPGKFGPPTVRAAFWIDETHVRAEIERGPNLLEARFVRENGRWLIDSGETVIGGWAPVATPASAALPMSVLLAIADLLNGESGNSTDSIVITASEPVSWPDSSLGCPKPGEFYAQVITPGYRVTVQYQGETVEVHTDQSDRAVRCDQE